MAQSQSTVRDTAQNTRKCVYCSKTKDWIWTGARLKDGSKIYVDEDARRWAGRRCPDCEKSRVVEAVRCDRFEREVVLQELRTAGYEIVQTTLPIKVIKDGVESTVAIKRAFADEEKQVVLEDIGDENANLVAVIFASARLFPVDKFERLKGASQLFPEKRLPRPST